MAVWITFFCLLDILFCGSPFVCLVDNLFVLFICILDHRHCRLVPVNVVPFTERVHDVQLDVGEGDHGVEHEGLELLVAAQVLAHRADALPVVHHVLAQVELDQLRI